MLSPRTLLALQRFTCVLCELPLLNAHTYPLIEPGQLLSQTTNIGPHHPGCAQKHLENLLFQNPDTQTNFPYIAALWTVQTSPTSPSGRIMRLHEEDADSTVIHLFSPLTINVIVTVAHPARPLPLRLGGRAKPPRYRFNLVTRAADYDEIQQWMLHGLQEAATLSKTEAEQSDLVQQIARLHKHFPKRTTPGIQEPASPTSES